MVGVISDTHGLLRPEAVAALQGCSRIIHAGDVGKPEILAALARIAPTTAVRGNVDRGTWALALPPWEMLFVEDATIYVLHDFNDLEIDPTAAGVRIVISGHSHQPSAVEKGGVLYLNPGAAGPRRFRLPVTLARLEVHRGGRVDTRLIDLLGP